MNSEAEVVVHGNVWDEADAHARQIVEKNTGGYVHPFDQPSTWRGHATIVEELRASWGFRLWGAVEGPFLLEVCRGSPGSGPESGLGWGVDRAVAWGPWRSGQTRGS